MPNPEELARAEIDRLLTAAGWHVCDVAAANLQAVRGVAIRELPLASGFDFADNLLYVDGKAVGVIEAKKQGATLTGVEIQSGRYAQGLPAALPAWRRPLPFVYESTGVETHFTNGLDPVPRARSTFAFHRPETLATWVAPAGGFTGLASGSGDPPLFVVDEGLSPTFLARMQALPRLVTEWADGAQSRRLWPAQIKAIENLERSLAANKPRALIQMATGSGRPCGRRCWRARSLARTRLYHHRPDSRLPCPSPNSLRSIQRCSLGRAPRVDGARIRSRRP